MASASLRRTSQRIITLLVQLAFAAALFSGLANGAAGKETVKYTLGDFEYDVDYHVPFYIRSTHSNEGGFAIGLNGYIHLTAPSSNGGIIQLVSTSGASRNTPVYVNDTVYIASFDRRPPEVGPGWGWIREGESEWFLRTTTSSVGRAEFKIIPANSLPIWPPRNFYYLQSCPGSYCSGLARYRKDGVTYVKLGEKGSEYGDIVVSFHPVNVGSSFHPVNVGSMSTDS